MTLDQHKAATPSAPSGSANGPKPPPRGPETQDLAARDLVEQAPFMKALLADARMAAAHRGERHEFRSRLDGVLQALRLMLQTDAFLALVAYRVKVRLRARGVPVLPWIAHRIAMASSQVSIADTAVVHPGVLIPHGQVVVEGAVEIEPFVTLQPWVTLGPLRGDVAGPRIRMTAIIGTGAKVLGAIEVGAGARVGTNSVVVDDVPPNTTVVGMPAQAVAD
jgi:serine O-acetyltransferase